MNPMHLAQFATARGLRYGWRQRRLEWLLDVTDGQLTLRPAEGHAAALAPYVRRSGTGLAPRPATDTLAYLTGKGARVWREATLEALAGSPSLAAGHARQVLSTADLRHLSVPDRARPHDIVALTAHGQLLHEDPALTAWWAQRVREDLGAGEEGLCIACGEVGSLARLIPAYIPSARFGIRTAGDLALYPTAKLGAPSHARKAGGHLMCVHCAERIGAAVTALSESQDHHHMIGTDTMLLWWRPDGGTPLPLARLLTRPDPAALAGLDLSGRHCALLLTGVSGRLSWRHFWDEPAAETAVRISDWYDRTAIYDGARGDTTHYGISMLHRAATDRWQPRTEEYTPAPSSIGPLELWTAALNGSLPREHGEAALAAIRADAQVSGPRVAIIRASGLAGEPVTAVRCTVGRCPNSPAPGRGGHCVRHYYQRYRTGQPKPAEWVYGRTGCDETGCNEPHRAKGKCSRHYDAQRAAARRRTS
ncbi:type I-C CRISPR-associated protein Cas8c/Csd1 [Streptomyces xiamenensis]|uniref:type I-C CRISPR-associated protein Cas8c/Csd1 n=1 Tax=Streptomyces xiamenensis TaxID=408015 RepID=UPI0035DD7A31